MVFHAIELAENPSPAAYLTMRVDLSLAGRGELSIVAIRHKTIMR